MIDPDEILELKREDAWNRKRQRQLSAHPDCRDPDHPEELCPYCRPVLYNIDSFPGADE